MWRRPADAEAEESIGRASSSGEERYVEMSAQEQVVLTVSRQRLRQAHLVLRVPRHRPRRQRHRRDDASTTATASWWRRSRWRHSDQIMLVTDEASSSAARSRTSASPGRSTQGVIVFDTAEDEHVVSVEQRSARRETARTATGRNISSSSFPGRERQPESMG